MPHHAPRHSNNRVWRDADRMDPETEVRVKVVVLMISLTCILSAATAAVQSSRKAKRECALTRRRINWREHARPSIEEGVFRRKYRMTLPTSRNLVRLLGPSLVRDERFARLRSAPGFSSVESRVAVGIRILAGGSYLDLVDTFGASITAVYECLWSTVDAINNTEGIEDRVFPQDTEACRRLASAFEEKSTARGWHVRRCRSCRRAGLFVKTEAPATTESLNTTEYFADQKKAFGLNVQAIASANYRFISVSIKRPGSVNDFSAFRRSRAWDLARSLTARFFLVGDAAYPLDESLPTPYPGKRLKQDYDVFNFYLSQQRMVVQQSFGILVQTWGILWKPLRLSFAGRADVIYAISRLHNYLRDEGMDPVTPTEDDSRDSAAPNVDSDGILPDTYKTTKCGRPKRGGGVQRRADIREALADLDLKRPRLRHNVSRNGEGPRVRVVE